MTSFKCPANCGKKFITNEHAMSHADITHPDWIEESKKQKGWRTPYGFIDFRHPVSYEEACERMKGFSDTFWNKTAMEGQEK